jgi:hypothetical protein
LILDELKSDSPDFNELCNSVSEIQQLFRSGNKGHTVMRRHISLPLTAKGHSRENVRTAVRCEDSSRKNVINVKGSCMVVAIMVTVRAIPTMVAQVRRVISVA